jgi:hypothetical protein
MHIFHTYLGEKWFHLHFHNQFHKGDGSMYSTTGLREIVSFLLAGLDFFFFPQLILLLVVGLLGQVSLRVGTLMGLYPLILRVQTFLLRQLVLQQILWVILFFFSGVLRLKGVSSAGANLGDSGLLWRSTEPSLL